jgi:hypothetical protein
MRLPGSRRWWRDMVNTNMRQAAAKGRATHQEQAKRRAADLAPIIAEIRASGATSLGQITDALNARGIPAARGGAWSKTPVARLLKRI